MKGQNNELTVATIFQPVQIGPLTLRNPVIKAATSEGRSPEGKVTQALIDFHRGFIEGGIAMTTLAYCAISKEGFAAPGEILMVKENIVGLKNSQRPCTKREVKLQHS
ncbi:hypothetical protein QNH98_19380 [Myroides sp. mNGS23_01]|nr:hypothetical protein [Myroides sp. mNGS23_01]WHT39077.1 hypothetical protein QNH98_19380 [Myroides sp. mNGS23_01]